MANISKRPSGNYRVQIRRKGQAPISKTFPSLAKAEAFVEEMEYGGRRNRIILRDALIRYELTVTPTKKSADQERYRIGQWLKEDLAERDLVNIKPVDIAAWRDRQVLNGFAPTTIRNALSIISQVYRVAATEWGFEHLNNPVLKVRLPKNRPGRERRLENNEYERLIEAAKLDCNLHIEPAIKLAVHTAMRQGELTSIEWDDVDIENRVIKLPQHITKTSRSRSIPLSSIAIEVLKSLPHDEKRVLPVGKHTLIKAWVRVRRAAKIEGLTFHDLRREAVSRLFEKGLSPYQIMSISGHTTTSMLKRYTQFEASKLADLLG